MRATRAEKGAARKPLLLTRAHEEILKAIHFYRYMATQDVVSLLYSPGAKTHVRAILSRLTGGADFAEREFLYRFRVPTPTGNSERVYTLGSRGRDFIERELGLPVDWYFRPDKVRHFSYSHITHSLILTRFLVAAKRWCREHPDFRLSQVRTSYELVQTPARVEVGYAGRKEVIRVVPDAWLLFEKLQDGEHDRWYPVVFEIDRGTEYQTKFKQHIRGRVEYIKRDGPYSRLFGHEAVIIAYATTGERPGYRETRRATMCKWTQEVLTELHKENWASVFRFHALSLDEIYETPLFEESVWFRPDMASPVLLFG